MGSFHFHPVSAPLLFLFLFITAVVAESSYGDCVYSIYVKTGSIVKAGTDSKISLTVGDAYGPTVKVDNLRSWGLMGPTHDYYERGNLDIFSGRGTCLSFPLCRLNLTSDGAGHHPGWYCDYVEVTSTGPHMGCAQTIFFVRQWLANDAPPYELTALLDGCDEYGPPSLDGERGKMRFVVNNKNVIGYE